MPLMDDKSREPLLKSLEQREVSLVRALLKTPELLEPRAELAIRTAISLSHLYRIKGADGVEVDVEEAVGPLREETLKLLEVAGIKEKENGSPAPEKLRPIATILRDHALRTQETLYNRFSGVLPRERIDREVRTKALVIAAGGGGGSGHIYLGAFKLLEECGLRPALIAGTSMGAILGLFRARRQRWETADIISVMRSLSWSKLFRVLSMESRYGLPAALRLYLRAAISSFFDTTEQDFPISQTAVPLIAAVSGIRAGVLPHPLEYYEGLLSDVRLASPIALGRKIPKIVMALMELFQVSERFDPVYIGLDEGTENFDAIDAVGFSSALPGVIHYDVVREDQPTHQALAALFAKRDLFRLCDGCLVDNVPARAAWLGVQKGMIGTRNAFILAMDCFAPKLTTPAWLPMQSIVIAQVQRSCEHAHLYKAFKNPPSPLEVIPSINSTLRILERGKEELAVELPFIQRMLKPLPALE